jgi:hypothetical protein
MQYINIYNQLNDKSHAPHGPEEFIRMETQEKSSVASPSNQPTNQHKISLLHNECDAHLVLRVGLVLNFEHLDLKEQRGVGRNDAGGALGTVGKVRRADELGLLTE